ncbi:DUF4179 domain-containing protein [Gottfriedia sp. S16(2024)]|uniref:DUF4179 domain-containing protein n=1 Tax=Gottfriedia sp. S16(2024) TaxID=3162883 RepID=UPI003D23514F
MDKQTFLEHVDSIEVPQEDVIKAIKIGVNRAQTVPTLPSIKKGKKVITGLAVAASLLLISSFIVPEFSHALADTPLIGNFYETFNQLIGRNLEQQKLVTKLNQSSTNQGIDVKIKGAYYDGNVIGFEFHINGDLAKSDDGRYYVMYKLFGGDTTIDDSTEITEIKKTKNGFSGNIQFYNFSKEVLKNMEIPLSFTKIGEKEGNWDFNVPIQQIQATEFLINGVDGKNEKENVLIKVTSILYGKASTVINYQVSYPASRNYKTYGLNVSNTSGKEIPVLSDGVVQKNEKDSILTVERRVVISQVLNEKYSDIFVKPTVLQENFKEVEFKPIRIELNK